MHAQIGTELSLLRQRELRDRAARGRPDPSTRRPAPRPPVDRT